jgi:hypothetical protein
MSQVPLLGRRLRRFLRRATPAAGAVKAPVKVVVTARKIRADGTLGEDIPVKNVRVSQPDEP